MVDVIQYYQDDCPDGFYYSAKKLTKDLITYNGKTLWDGRKDH
jgi:hypothetical protein